MTNEYENALRRLIIQIIGAEDSSPFKVTEDRIAKWKEKRETEIKKNKGISYENRIIYYSDFYDLYTIIDKNWNLFLPILYSKRRFEVFFSEIETYRNTVAHGRNLTSSQEHLLKGIVSDLKNMITIYHNKNEMKEDYFIRISKVSDNLGNIWEEGRGTKQPVLRVGDRYELNIEANDPKDRKIVYEISNLGGFKISQNLSRFNFVIDNKLIGAIVLLLITADTPDSDYENKSTALINLTVLPE